MIMGFPVQKSLAKIELWGFEKKIDIKEGKFDEKKVRWKEVVTVSSLIKVESGISRTNADSQWNPIYEVCHQILSLGSSS